MRGGVWWVFVSLWLRLSRVVEWVLSRKLACSSLTASSVQPAALCNPTSCTSTDAMQNRNCNMYGEGGIVLYCFAARISTLCSGLGEIKHRWWKVVVIDG